MGTMLRNTLAIAFVWALLPGVSVGDEFRESIGVEPGGTLEVDLAAGSVEVETHDDPEVSVEARASGMQFRLEGDGTDAQLSGEVSGFMRGIFGGLSVRVRVRVPEQYSLVIRTAGGSIEVEEIDGEVEAKTSGGSIAVEGAKGQVQLRTSGGGIRAEEVYGDIFARTSGGSIRIEEVSGEVDARTSGGGIQVHDAGGPVRVRTSGGSVSARFSGVPEGSLETSGGSIEVEIPEDAAVTIDAKTSGGRVRIDSELRVTGTLQSSHIVGDINGGGPELRIRTSGGNIRVEER
jgi:DUF4097 and DUF4098 domain-containing protein YvlB